MIVQGRIDKFKAEQFFRDKGKEEETYLGQTIYHDGDGGFVFLDGVVLMGQLEAVKKGLDQMSLPGSTPLQRGSDRSYSDNRSGQSSTGPSGISPLQIFRLPFASPRRL